MKHLGAIILFLFFALASFATSPVNGANTNKSVGTSTNSVKSVGTSTNSVKSVGTSTNSVKSVGTSTNSVKSVGTSTNSVNNEVLTINPIQVEVQNSRSWITNVVTVVIPLLGMIITIAVVMRTSKVSLLTISEKTRETLRAYEETIQTQREIADKNLKAQVRSKNRQDWINELRLQIANFIALLPVKRDRLRTELSKETDYSAAQQDSKMRGDPMGKESLKRANEEYWQAKRHHDECHLEIARTISKVDLLLNPNEKDSADLISIMKKAFEDSSNTELAIDNKELEEVIVAITKKTQTILKREWEKVKSIE